MKNLWLAAHLGEIEGCLGSLSQRGYAVEEREKSTRWQVPQLQLEICRTGQGQAGVRKAVQSLPSEQPLHIFLFGVAGALNLEISKGSVHIQTRTERSFYLSSTPVLTSDERDQLFLKSTCPVVVMESFWSDPVLVTGFLNSSPHSFTECRIVSDHCQSVDLQSLRQQLPAWMNALTQQMLTFVAQPGH